uniref:Uncharacterized protein n=1 Tax=Ditylenchus dipsaci TaxID=166011 RepID=A0A915E1F1_9BILA
MRTVHHIRLKAQPRLYRSPMQSLIAQQQQSGENLQPSSAVQLYSQPLVEDADHVHGEMVDHPSSEAVEVDATVLTPEQVLKSEEIPLDNV